MVEKLVSIMIPCYNGEKYLDRLFNSFYAQTYKKQQIIFVNDGSVDQTEKLALYYKDKLKKEGIQFIYLSCKNRGQAAAINIALQFVVGEYCMWFDVDDYMTVDHIEKKVEFLENNPDKELVMCKGCIVEEYTDNFISKLGYEKPVGSLFRDVLFEYRRCTPGLYMVRTDTLFSCLKDKRIYESKAGQNLQLILPVALKQKNGYLDEMLFYYVFRKNSHSRAFYSDEDMIKRIDDLKDLRMHIIENLETRENYKKILKHNVNLFTLLQKISQMNEKIFGKKLSYVDRVRKEYCYVSGIEQYLNHRELYIWGACPSGNKIKGIFEKDTFYTIKGYVDRDESKIGKKYNNLMTWSVEILDKKKIYLLIPLEIHGDILQILQKKGFEIRKDYFYPQYELRNFVENGWYADYKKERNV